MPIQLQFVIDHEGDSSLQEVAKLDLTLCDEPVGEIIFLQRLNENHLKVIVELTKEQDLSLFQKLIQPLLKGSDEKHQLVCNFEWQHGDDGNPFLSGMWLDIEPDHDLSAEVSVIFL